VLEELHITDFALIDEVLIEFGSGLNVLTGETGAGKTILLAALGLLLGGRADTTAIRSGAADARVEGRFRADGRDGELILARVVSREGKSKCYANGSLVAVTTLAELTDGLVDLHGQHEHQALLRAAHHVDYLDRFCGSEQMARREQWSRALARLRDVQVGLAELARSVSERERRRDFLLFQIDEIVRAQLVPGEDEEIAGSLEVLRNAERLASAAAGTKELLAADEDGSGLEAVRRGLAALGAVERIDPRLDGLRSRLESCGFELEEVAHELRAYSENIEFDPAVLADAQTRMADIGDLKRKYGATIQEVLEFAARASAELERLDSAAGGVGGLEKERVQLECGLGTLATGLSAARKKAAAGFERRILLELAALGMQKARFVVDVCARPAGNGDSYGATGPDEVEFLFSSNAGEPPRPLAKIASGGEISRLMLAAKIVLGAADEVKTLVFDEIDAGVGGKTAAAVGAKLAELAASHQVICVTHLPQIASVATRHFSVNKLEAKGRTLTEVAVLDDEQRVAEVARMLSGAKVSETSLRHAREMLEGGG